MKPSLKPFAPRPSADFAQKLEQTLLARGEWKKIPIKPSFSMKRLSLVYGSSLLLAAVTAGLLYPFGPSDDYVANAMEYYENYEPDGIVYQKVEKYMMHPKGGDSDTHYTYETWSYQGNELMLTSKIDGDLYDMISMREMTVTDDYGNTYSYADPKNYATDRDPVVEAPYCVLNLSTDTEEWQMQSVEAFEVSPNALTFFDAFVNEQRDYSFTQDGETRDHMYVGTSGTNFEEKNPTLKNNRPTTNWDLRDAITAADSSPEQAELLFEFLSQGTDFTHEVTATEEGETRHVFRLPPQAYNVDENGIPTSSAQSIEEFVFNDHYQLLEYNFYKDTQLMEQTKYIEEAVLPSSEKTAIFNPQSYGLELVTFDHPLVETPQDFACFSFQNEPLSQDENAEFATSYAPMIEHIKTRWGNDTLPRLKEMLRNE